MSLFHDGESFLLRLESKEVVTAIRDEVATFTQDKLNDVRATLLETVEVYAREAKNIVARVQALEEQLAHLNHMRELDIDDASHEEGKMWFRIKRMEKELDAHIQQGANKGNGRKHAEKALPERKKRRTSTP